jgi:hypothetical protein
MAMAAAKKQDIFTRFTSNVAKAMGHPEHSEQG